MFVFPCPFVFKVWMAYADQTASPGDIFKFMHKNKIGAKVALFWAAWAFVSEKGGQDNFADKLFVKGIAELAMPIELLHLRQKQFQRRLARKFLNAQEVSTHFLLYTLITHILTNLFFFSTERRSSEQQVFR